MTKAENYRAEISRKDTEIANLRVSRADWRKCAENYLKDIYKLRDKLTRMTKSRDQWEKAYKQLEKATLDQSIERIDKGLKAIEKARL